jgi:M6 family metalloprotease-like protein
VPGVTEGRSLPGTVAPSTGPLRALLLLVHASDAPRDESTAAPERMFDSAADWFRSVSYGRLDFSVDTLPQWLPLPARSAEYAANGERYLRDAITAADPHVDFSRVDVVYLAPASRTPETRTSAILNGFGIRVDGRDIRLWVPWGAGFSSRENTDPYLLLHETGHLLGLPDLYAANAPPTFHRWDVMAARYPAELLAWHRWKLGWLDQGQIVCVAGRASRTVTLTPIERPSGLKAVFVKRGHRIYAVEVRSRLGDDRTLCETGVLVYAVDQSPFRRAPVHIYPAQRDRDPPRRDCASMWNAPFDVGRNERRVLRLPGLRVEVIDKRGSGAYRVRVAAG